MENITERLALLTLDNRSRTLTETADLRLGYGLCGALMLDLMLQGALLEEGESLRPVPQAVLNTPYLQEAFAVVPSYSAQEPVAVFKAIYAILPRLKELVLDALVQQGLVREDMAKLKWSFALKSYVLKPQHAGYRDAVFHALCADSIHLRDCWTLQLAEASHLLWAEEGEDKKTVAQVTRQLRLIGDATGQLRQLCALVAEGLPENIARSHKLGKLGKKTAHPTIWEWRGFWLDKGPTLIQASEMYKQSLEHISFSEMQDSYLIVEGMAENMKWRKGVLEVKRPEDSLEGYTAFSPKKIYNFPLSPAKLAQLFPALGETAKPVKTIEALCALLQAQGIRAELVEVRKKRFQVKLQSRVKVEFCTLQFGGRKYLSACVEGPDYDITHAHSHNFQMGDVMEMGYVEFLKHCQMETAT